MEPRISIVTLGVDDLGRARRFYEQLGWQAQETQETVFLQAGPLALILWGRDKLAADCGLPGPDGQKSFDGVVLAQNVRSPADVDDVLSQAAQVGAVVTRPAAETFYGGYAGVFTDPDGHAWEIAYNPGFPLAADGSMTIPDFGEDPAPAG